MKIEVKVYEVKGNSKLKANVSLKLDDLFIINGFKVVQGKKDVFVAKPNHEYNGKYYDDVYLLDKAKNDSLNALILQEYEKTISNKVDNDSNNTL